MESEHSEELFFHAEGLDKNDGDSNPNLDESGDFIFRFKLDLQDSAYETEQALTETYRHVLKNFLNILVFTHKGKEVQVDGFKVLVDRETNILINSGDDLNEPKAKSITV